MLDVLVQCLNNSDESNSLSCLQSFIEIEFMSSAFLKPVTSDLILLCIQIASQANIISSVRQASVELLVTISESRPSIINKNRDVVRKLVEILLNMLLESSDDDDLLKWTKKEEDSRDYVSMAEEYLDRVSFALGGETLLPVIIEYASVLLKNENWKNRRTGLLAISQIGEGCTQSMKPILSQILSMVLSCCRDSDPRVRWAAANTIGLLSTDFGPKFQKHFHKLVLPELMILMDDFNNPRVQSRVAKSLVNFCHQFDSQLLEIYLDNLMNKLLLMLQKSSRALQEVAVSVIGAVADCADTKFAKYYDVVVPILKTILREATTNEMKSLRGKAMECITCIGESVGKTKFFNDAKEVMEIIQKILVEGMKDDDPQKDSMLQAWARICRCLERDFIPYLPYVVPPVFQAASIPPDVVTRSRSESNDEEEGWDYVDIADQRVAIHTVALEEKTAAIDMLRCYADIMKDAYFPWVEQTSKLVAPLAEFFFNEGLRKASVSTFPSLIRSAAEYNKINPSEANYSYLLKLFEYHFKYLLQAIYEEKDLEVLVIMIEAFHQSISALGSELMTDEQVRLSIDTIVYVVHFLTENREKRATNEESVQDELKDADEDRKEEEVEHELADIIGALLKNNPKQFLNVFPVVHQFVGSLIHPKFPASDRALAVCIFDEIIEFCKSPEIVNTIFKDCFQYVLQCATDANHALRQASLYGVGLCAEKIGPLFSPFITESLQKLLSVINDPKSRTDNYGTPTDNAISSIAKIIKFQGKHVNVNQLLPQWLSWLPTTDDPIECIVVHGQLCDFIETHKAVLFGDSFERLPLVLKVFAEIVGTEYIDEAVSKRILYILNQLSSLPATLLSTAFNTLSQDQQLALKSFMNQSSKT
eukprot:TRINITY_DN3423_c0_g1_i1.p1 TRINITY_DN3423_c0_g1~~TRINITY_DN3423_c0_g1_i1.p1  ORF type:complete len:876 (-),score=130.93 TRINITY_DN3423_c0_g1_i1:36-2663(-)